MKVVNRKCLLKAARAQTSFSFDSLHAFHSRALPRPLSHYFVCLGKQLKPILHQRKLSGAKKVNDHLLLADAFLNFSMVHTYLHHSPFVSQHLSKCFLLLS
jgi:hypothetical protein